MSIIVFILIGAILGTALAATYLWITRTTTITVQEPLTLTEYPTVVQTHPGQNQTLSITLTNAAAMNYTVTLAFALNDTTYQTDYVTFSNYTYTVSPGTNQLTAWILIAKRAPPTTLELTTQFYRE